MANLLQKNVDKIYITNDSTVNFDFYSLTFCYAAVIPLLVIFLTITSVRALQIMAVLGAGTKYHALIDIYEEKIVIYILVV